MTVCWGCWLQVDAYIMSTDGSQAELLTYWETKSAVWTRLSHVVRGVLCIPAASTASERAFSLTGRTIDDRRTQLSEDSVDGLMFLHVLSWTFNVVKCRVRTEDYWTRHSVIMVALCNRADHYIFALWFLSSIYHLFFISSPNLSGRRLDVYRTSTYGVALVRI